MRLDRRVLSKLAAGRQVVLVTGTNGKTTTSHFLACALETLGGEVAHNASGSNMADGAVGALMARPGARWAVVEVDELHLAGVAEQIEPYAIVVLNLSRDQLDRAAEVRQTARAINQAVARRPKTVVFANADDPMTVWAVRCDAEDREVIWVGLGARWRADTVGCPCCGRALDEGARGWWCGCGLVRPEPQWVLRGRFAQGPGVCCRLETALPGDVNQANALVALAVAVRAGGEAQIVARAIGGVDSVAGRYGLFSYEGREVRLLVAKNPAGWAATWSMLPAGRPVVIAVNARQADGRDTSWLWDVDFARLEGRIVVASGERAADVGVRLSYAGVRHSTVADPLEAIGSLSPGELDVVGNYTAFHDLHGRLGPLCGRS